MTSRSNSNAHPADAPPADFESALEKLVLESFAEGAQIEGTWEVTSPASVVPDWRVTIEKTGKADLPQDNATFLDE